MRQCQCKCQCRCQCSIVWSRFPENVLSGWRLRHPSVPWRPGSATENQTTVVTIVAVGSESIVDQSWRRVYLWWRLPSFLSTASAPMTSYRLQKNCRQLFPLFLLTTCSPVSSSDVVGWPEVVWWSIEPVCMALGEYQRCSDTKGSSFLRLERSPYWSRLTTLTEENSTRMAIFTSLHKPLASWDHWRSAH